MTDPLEGSGDTSPATPPTTPGVSAFILLPEDLLVEILASLEINDVLSLRQVCKATAQATRLRALWIHLAHREVLDRKLWWPTCALPLTSVPTRALEEYTLRAPGINRQWIPGTDPQKRKFQRCIIRPPNSIGWLRVLKGRWLILELRQKQLELWDLRDEVASEPVALYNGLAGHIDGSNIDASEGSSVVLGLSTSSYITYYLKIDLPYLGECGPIPNFVPLETVNGYSGLVDARGGLAVFSHSVSNKTPLVRDMHTGSIVHLGGFDVTERPQCLSSALILKEHIVLMSVWKMELYPITELRSLMHDGHQATSPQVAYPSHSLDYPDGEMADHIAVLDRHSEHSEARSRNTGYEFSLGIYIKRSCSWTRLLVQLGADPNPTAFTISTKVLFHTMGHRTIACCWGESGQRLLLATSYGASVRLGCKITPSDSMLFPGYDDNTAFRWAVVPYCEIDLFAGFAFDEAHGVCAAATCGGRVWIDDLSKPSPLVCKCTKLDMDSVETPPHPDPLWPVLHSIPWPANVADNFRCIRSLSEPVPWSTEVEHHFPMINDPRCYGGAQWFVNEALHIPGPASLVMFTISTLEPYPLWSNRIIQISGGRLVAVDMDAEMGYSVKLLAPDIHLSQIPSLIPYLFAINGQPGLKLGVDYAVVRRYMFWRGLVEGDRGINSELW